MRSYVVALYAMGSFKAWATDPIDLEDAREFVAGPPECWAPRPQDSLLIFELTEEDAE